LGDVLLHVTVEDRADSTVLTIEGSIDEASDFPKVQLGSRNVVLVPSGVNYVSSVGVLKWIAFLKKLQSRVDTIVIRELSPALVMQAGMVKNFLQGVEVESYVATYSCEECSQGTSRIFTFEEDPPDELEAPCADCGSRVIFDQVRERYFAFRHK
jgi:anti-anti-sigma regulatory factor/DNA-directed RNA polymerase subunit RPC12/RpoP